uniref:Cytosolic purine 5'-nucleotidase n=2 Tax=Pararge aegeria TaxID=116150 RepID=S4PXM2_9NEOP
MFRAPAMLMPHESTVAHEQRFTVDTPTIDRSRHPSSQRMYIDRSFATVGVVEESNEVVAAPDNTDGKSAAAGASVPHARPETPQRLTHTHDEDCSDDEDVSKAHK